MPPPPPRRGSACFCHGPPRLRQTDGVTRADILRDRIVAEVAATGFRAHGLRVCLGDDVAAHDWSEPVRRDIHSAAKGVCVLAAAIASDEGLIDLDAPLADLLPGTALADAELGEGVGRVSLRRLLSMTSGVDLPWSETMMTDWPDLAREFLSRPSRGRAFQYSNASTYTAMRVLATRTGDVLDYLGPRLLHPLAIHDAVWERCPLGHVVAGGGLALTTDELSRIGLLIRDRGRWQGRSLVSARWIEAMHADGGPAASGPGYERYALSGWGGPGNAWRLHGAYGQLVIFAADTVVTVTADDHAGADALAAAVVTLAGA